MTLARVKSVFECIHKHIKIQNIAGTIFLVSCISFAFDAYPYVHDIIVPLIIFLAVVCTVLFAILFYKTGVVENPKEDKFINVLAFFEFYSCVVFFVCLLVALLSLRAGNPTEKTAMMISDKVLQNMKPHQEEAATYNYTTPEADLTRLVLGNDDLTLEEASAYLEYYNFKFAPYSFEGEDGEIGERFTSFYLPERYEVNEWVRLELIFHEKYGLCVVLHTKDVDINSEIREELIKDYFYLTYNPSCYWQDGFNSKTVKDQYVEPLKHAN